MFDKVRRFNHYMFALAVSLGLVGCVGALVFLLVVSVFDRGDQNTGVAVDGAEQVKNEKGEVTRVVSVSEPFFYSRNDNRFLIAEVEINGSNDGKTFYLGSGGSWSGTAWGGSTVLNFYRKEPGLLGCHSCWFRNLKLFSELGDQGRKVFEKPALVTRFYFPSQNKRLDAYSAIEGSKLRGKLPDFILFSVVENDQNKDGILNDKDGENTFISNLSMTKKIKVLPAEVKLIDWKIDPQAKNIFFFVKTDTNNNKKFDELDKGTVLSTSLSSPGMAIYVDGEPIN